MPEPIDEDSSPSAVAADPSADDPSEVQIVTRAKLRTVSLFLCSVVLVSLHSILVADTGGASAFWSFSWKANSTATSVTTVKVCASAISLLVARNSTTTSGLQPSSHGAFVADTAAEELSNLQRLTATSVVVFVALVLPSFSAVYWYSDALTSAALCRAGAIAAALMVSLMLWLATLIAVLVETADLASADASVADGSSTISLNWPMRLTIVAAIFTLFVLIWATKRTWHICCGNVTSSFPDENVESSEMERKQQREDAARRKKEIRRKKKELQNAAAMTGDAKIMRRVEQNWRKMIAPEEEPMTFYKTRNGLGRGMLTLVLVGAFFTVSASSSSWISVLVAGAENTTSTQVYSPLFRSAKWVVEDDSVVDSVARSISQAFNSSNNGCSLPGFAERLSSIHLGLNGAALCCALIFALGTVLGWSWCVVPFAVTAFVLSLTAVVTVGVVFSEVEHTCSFSTAAAAGGGSVVKLSFAIWVEVASVAVWFCAVLLSVAVQQLPDRFD